MTYMQEGNTNQPWIQNLMAMPAGTHDHSLNLLVYYKNWHSNVYSLKVCSQSENGSKG